MILTESPEEMSARTARPGEINGDFVDRFTLVHFGAGGVARRLGMSLPLTIAAAVAFEIAEREMKRTWPQAFPNPTQDTFVNALGDVLAAAAGWFLGKKRFL